MAALLSIVRSAAFAATFIVASAFLAPAATAQSASLAIHATGTIPSACSIAVASGFPGNINFASPGSAPATATVNCSQAFKLNAQSANGGVTTPAVSAGFASSLDYALNLDVALDSAADVSASCNASTLTAGMAGCALSPAGAGLSSGGKTATNKTATLTISWTPPTSPRLVAGNYSDTITLSIAAAQ